MKTFFNQIAALLQDKQQLRMTIAKTSDELTVMVTAQGKIINASGTAEELDEKLIPAIQAEVESKSFTFSVSDAPKNKEGEEEESEIDKGVAECKKVVKDGDALIKKKKYVEALEIYEKASKMPHLAPGIDKKIVSAKKSIDAIVKKLIKEGDALLKKKKNKEAGIKYASAIDLNKLMGVEDKLLEDAWKKTAEEPVVVVQQTNLETAITIAEEEKVVVAEEVKQEEVVDQVAIDLAAKQKVFDEYIIAGADFLKSRNFEDAKKSYDAALLLFPENESAKNQLSKVSTIMENLELLG